MNYSSQAAEKGVYIIGSCGFDSIPADMGVLYTRDQFKGMQIVTQSTHSVYMFIYTILFKFKLSLTGLWS